MTNKEYSDFLIPNVKYDYNYYLKKYKKRKETVVTRFAPSPTGFIHIGSLFTAFINIEIAKQQKGICFLRIEDTDQQRKIENGTKEIIKSFNNLGYIFDESYENDKGYGPYIQSEREDIYKAFAKELIEQDKAYPCFCSKEEIEEIRTIQEKNKERIGYYGKYAKCRNLTKEEVINKIKNGQKYIIRLKSTGNFNKKVILNDLIKGQIEMPENDLDIVIIKSDGLPTYHFAHAIDDHLMGTTHVLRSDEWLSSFPIHYELFKTLGFDLPKYGHIAPICVKENNKIRKLSKRKDKEAAISYYEELGIPPIVINLYLATLMNSNFEEWYLENHNKAIEDFNFTFNKMASGGTLFDLNKLINISKIYFSRQKGKELLNDLLNYLNKYDQSFYQIVLNNKELMIKALDIEKYIEKPRKDITCYKDVKKYLWFMFDDLFNETSYEGLLKKPFYDINIVNDYFNNYYDKNDTKEEWLTKLKELAYKNGFSKEVKEYKNNKELYKGHIGDICELIRIAITSMTKTPDLYEILQILDKDSINKRINYFNEYLNK